MKLRIPFEQADQDDDIDLTPMIDCVFLLVLFFMVTSSFLEEVSVFEVQLPRADRATRVAREQANIISLSDEPELDGQYDLKQPAEPIRRVTAPELLEALSKPDPAGKVRPVFLRYDQNCRGRQIAEAMNLLKEARVETIFTEVEFSP
jgi:biopolymer transport protein ExbD